MGIFILHKISDLILYHFHEPNINSLVSWVFHYTILRSGEVPNLTLLVAILLIIDDLKIKYGVQMSPMNKTLCLAFFLPQYNAQH